MFEGQLEDGGNRKLWAGEQFSQDLQPVKVYEQQSSRITGCNMRMTGQYPYLATGTLSHKTILSIIDIFPGVLMSSSSSAKPEKWSFTEAIKSKLRSLFTSYCSECRYGISAYLKQSSVLQKTRG